MQAGVGAVIAAVVYEMAGEIIHGKNRIAIVIMVLSFVAACILGVNVIYIVLVCGVFGGVRTLVKKQKGGRR
ncbi:chromate transport protein ChrA [Catenibacillus scindens]|uniref:Chromate transport protein ChrA n=2 Tax=Catenibacillus scindens TaxID=673271 RepID=A0A7W8HCZ5_9FIRM|nr:chromate transport protein ChrA [Catenibacillus scindens]